MLHRFESFEPRRIEEREPQAKLLRKKQEEAEKIVNYVRNKKTGITHADFIYGRGMVGKRDITPEMSFLKELYYSIVGLRSDNILGFEVRNRYSHISFMEYNQQTKILHVSSFFANRFDVENVKTFLKEMFKKHFDLEITEVTIF